MLYALVSDTSISYLFLGGVVFAFFLIVPNAMYYSMRMMQALHALRLRDWPHHGPIGIRESDAITGRTEIHVLDRWRHLGSVDADTDIQDILQTRNDTPFDAGIYRILVQYFKSRPRESDVVALG